MQLALRREGESRVLAREAELQMLRTQINPHFLFNSLNSISALTSIDAGAAREMTIALAQFFRRTLALADRERVTLAEEIDLCRDFLAIEQRRFGAKLRAEWRVAPAAGPCLLPPMTLQPLLENAIKHGIRQLEGGGTITIDAVEDAGWLRLAVVNPVADAGASAPKRERGVGLANIRERFAAHYGPRARITWRRTPAVFEIELTLPAEKEASHEPAP
jgi:LytS/YehU family sensor histidine kinase